MTAGSSGPGQNPPPTPPPAPAPRLKTHRRLFAVLATVYALWIVWLVVLYFTTEWRRAGHPGAATAPSVQPIPVPQEAAPQDVPQLPPRTAPATSRP